MNKNMKKLNKRHDTVYDGEIHYVLVFRCICDALIDLVSFLQFKKCEKYPLRSYTFSKDEGWGLQLCWRCHYCMGVFHVFQIEQMVSNCKEAQSVTCFTHSCWSYLVPDSLNPLMPGGNRRWYVLKQTCGF